MAGAALRRVLIADDHPIVVRALHQLLSSEPDFEPIDVVMKGEEVLETAERTHPDIVLLDWAMHGIHPVPMIRELHEHLPTARIVAMSAQLIDREPAISAGAAGFISKTDVAERVLEILREHNANGMR